LRPMHDEPNAANGVGSPLTMNPMQLTVLISVDDEPDAAKGPDSVGYRISVDDEPDAGVQP